MEGDGFLFKASLKNNNIPELGTVTVEFPIPEAQYEETIRALNGIQSGAVVEQDCFVADIGTADCPALERLIGTMANVDELDWLGKQLESFDRYELLQFNAAVERFGLSAADELIDLSFCAREVTVVSDFNDLELVGKRHYEKDADGKFRVIPEQAEIVRELYKRYESGASLRNLQDWLEENQIKTVLGESKWTTTSIKSILTNEKYCGDVLLQKTFRTDVISKKVIKNVGQMTQYYMPDHHEGIVSREQYNAVKAEMARRSALRSPSKSAVTGRSCYTSKYALSDRLVCGECGTLYRRCTWTSLGRKYPVWRCTSRLNYGTKYCRDSPTIKEEPLQAAILAAINSAMSNKPALLDLIKNAVSLELLPVQGQTMSLADIERRLTQLDERFQTLLAEAIDAEDMEACNARFAEILAEQTALKKQKEEILQSSADADCISTRMKQTEEAIENTAQTITEWNENAVRQIVERVTVLSADEVLVRIKGGAEIKQRME